MLRVTRGFLALFVFLVTYTMTTPAGAQSFLGTVRGTVVDPQGSVVPGAAVLIVVTRAIGMLVPSVRNLRRLEAVTS